MICSSVYLEDGKGKVCGHSIKSHDSGGCCREPFCGCSHVHIAEPSHDEYFTESKAIVDQNPEPESKPLIGGHSRGALASFQIETASFADLAVWAYKARDFIRSLNG